MRNKAAYSLLELIVAGFIFASVSVALAGVFAYHYRAIGSSRLFLVAQYLARTRMDECMAAGYEKVLLFNDGVPPPAPVVVEFDIRDEKITTNFTVSTTVTSGSIPVGHTLPLRICTVQVSWPEKNRTRNVRYTGNVSPEA